MGRDALASLSQSAWAQALDDFSLDSERQQSCMNAKSHERHYESQDGQTWLFGAVMNVLSLLKKLKDKHSPAVFLFVPGLPSAHGCVEKEVIRLLFFSAFHQVKNIQQTFRSNQGNALTRR